MAHFPKISLVIFSHAGKHLLTLIPDISSGIINFYFIVTGLQLLGHSCTRLLNLLKTFQITFA